MKRRACWVLASGVLTAAPAQANPYIDAWAESRVDGCTVKLSIHAPTTPTTEMGVFRAPAEVLKARRASASALEVGAQVGTASHRAELDAKGFRVSSNLHRDLTGYEFEDRVCGPGTYTYQVYAKQSAEPASLSGEISGDWRGWVGLDIERTVEVKDCPVTACPEGESLPPPVICQVREADELLEGGDLQVQGPVGAVLSGSRGIRVDQADGKTVITGLKPGVAVIEQSPPLGRAGARRGPARSSRCWGIPARSGNDAPGRSAHGPWPRPGRWKKTFVSGLARPVPCTYTPAASPTVTLTSGPRCVSPPKATWSSKVATGGSRA